MTKEEEKGEFRPLVLKTDRESVLRGEDYWIDYSEVTRIDRIALEIFRTAAGQKFACLWVNGMFFSIAVRFTSNKLVLERLRWKVVRLLEGTGVDSYADADADARPHKLKN